MEESRDRSAKCADSFCTAGPPTSQGVVWLIWGEGVYFHVHLNSSLKPKYYWNFPILYIWTHAHWKTKTPFGLSLQMLTTKGQVKRRVRNVHGGLWWNRSGVTLSGRLFSPVCICSCLASGQYLTRLPSSLHPVGWAEGARECHRIPPVRLVHSYNPCILLGAWPVTNA